MPSFVTSAIRKFTLNATNMADYKPLNYGELSNFADLLVEAETDGDYSITVMVSHPKEGSMPAVPIIDAEGDVVCFCPADKAELMVRLLNTYQPVNYTGERRMT